MDFTETVKGNPCVIYDGYSYRRKRENKTGVVTWICTEDKNKYCCAKLKTKNNELLQSVGEHKCIPDEAALDVRKAIVIARKRAREDTAPISQIYKEEFESLQNRGYELITRVPSINRIKSCLYWNRNLSQGNQREPKLSEDVTFDDATLSMSNGESFLMADVGLTDKMLVFASTKGKEMLREGTSFFMDGTFRSCSNQFAQLYTIHVDLGSTKEETNVAPVLFALLPNKRTETYAKLFQEILNDIPDWRPEKVNVDFEAAVISALTEVFPATKIQGCFFHFTQRLWRAVQDAGLTSLYKIDKEIKDVIRMCAALAFLKPEDVEEGWLFIHSVAPESAKLTEFLDYFVNQWMENSSIPIEMWNCYRRRHRTTNAVEGWHHKINQILGRPHPRVKNVVQCLKAEAEASNLKIARIELNLEGVKRKRKYLEQDKRIEKTTEKYEETKDVPKLLRTMSYILRLD